MGHFLAVRLVHYIAVQVVQYNPESVVQFIPVEVVQYNPVWSDCVRSVRPGYGLAPKKLIHIAGKYVKRDVRKYESVQSELIDTGK